MAQKKNHLRERSAMDFAQTMFDLKQITEAKNKKRNDFMSESSFSMAGDFNLTKNKTEGFFNSPPPKMQREQSESGFM